MLNASDSLPAQRLYGRRKGRPLRARKAMLMRELLPKLKIELPHGEKLFNPAGLFPFTLATLGLEIGFGGGEHLAAQAKNQPAAGFIGCEPFLNGIASLLDHVDKNHLRNVRIFPGDARELIKAMPDHSVAQCFILFPDPWPKARHAKRRFIGPDNVPQLARILQPQAELRIATDDAQLKDWVRETMAAAPDFRKTYDASDPPPVWFPTRYEQKAVKAGRQPDYFVYERA